MKIINLTKADFLKKVANYENDSRQWEYLGDKPAVIEFFATWCGACRMFAPSFEEVAQEYGRVYFYRVDVDKEEDLAEAFNVRATPTLLFVPLKDAPQISQGAMSEDELKQAIDQTLLGK